MKKREGKERGERKVRRRKGGNRGEGKREEIVIRSKGREKERS